MINNKRLAILERVLSQAINEANRLGLAFDLKTDFSTSLLGFSLNFKLDRDSLYTTLDNDNIERFSLRVNYHLNNDELTFKVSKMMNTDKLGVSHLKTREVNKKDIYIFEDFRATKLDDYTLGGNTSLSYSVFTQALNEALAQAYNHQLLIIKERA
jgi:hypothetical protein